MKHKLTPILLFCFLISLPLMAVDKNSSSTNPLLGKFNEVIQFANLTAEHIKEATDVSIKEARITCKTLCNTQRAENLQQHNART